MSVSKCYHSFYLCTCVLTGAYYNWININLLFRGTYSNFQFYYHLQNLVKFVKIYALYKSDVTIWLFKVFWYGNPWLLVGSAAQDSPLPEAAQPDSDPGIHQQIHSGTICWHLLLLDLNMNVFEMGNIFKRIWAVPAKQYISIAPHLYTWVRPNKREMIGIIYHYKIWILQHFFIKLDIKEDKMFLAVKINLKLI